MGTQELTCPGSNRYQESMSTHESTSTKEQMDTQESTDTQKLMGIQSPWALKN